MKSPESIDFTSFSGVPQSRGDRIRTCGVLVPNQVPYQLGHTSFHLAARVISPRNQLIIP